MPVCRRSRPREVGEERRSHFCLTPAFSFSGIGFVVRSLLLVSLLSHFGHFISTSVRACFRGPSPCPSINASSFPSSSPPKLSASSLSSIPPFIRSTGSILRTFHGNKMQFFALAASLLSLASVAFAQDTTVCVVVVFIRSSRLSSSTTCRFSLDLLPTPPLVLLSSLPIVFRLRRVPLSPLTSPAFLETTPLPSRVSPTLANPLQVALTPAISKSLYSLPVLATSRHGT